MRKQSRPSMCQLLLVAVALSAAGCSSSRNVVTVQDSTKITKGKELADLQRAYAEGAISEAEYETLRQSVLKRRR